MAEQHHGGHGDPHGAHRSADDQYRETPPGAGYEHTDANARIIGHFLFWLVVAAVVVHVGMWGLFELFVVQRAEDVEAQQFPLAVEMREIERSPGHLVSPRVPGPRLQQFPLWEYEAFRRHEDARLHGYGWVDEAAGIAHIPIEEAMRLTVERGLPARTPDPEATDEWADHVPAGSSSGRTPRVRR